MPNEHIRPPGWLKPMNKVLMAMLRLGLPISRHEAPVVLTAPGRLSGKRARPILRAVPAAVPTGAQLMKRAGVLTEGTPDELEGLAGRLPVFRIDPIT